MEDFVGDILTAGRYLKSTSGWDNDANGLDTYGFAALLGGMGIALNGEDDLFREVGEHGYWWEALENEYEWNSMIAYSWLMNRYAGFGSDGIQKDRLVSVRCIQD